MSVQTRRLRHAGNRSLEELAKNKEVGYTTTLKLMQIMHDKGLVKRNTDANTHLYTAVISREQAQNTALDKILDTVFKRYRHYVKFNF